MTMQHSQFHDVPLVAGKSERPTTLPVWDPLVRLFHWSLLAAYAIGYYTQIENYELHLIAGYAVLALVCFRVLWGFIGSPRARFRDFVRGPRTTAHYLGALWRRRPQRFIGHNPAGAVMILALLVCLVVITCSGIALDAAENRAGPLGSTRVFLYGDLIARTHTLSTNISLALIGIHVIGVLVSSALHKENLVAAMLTGRKRVG